MSANLVSEGIRPPGGGLALPRSTTLSAPAATHRGVGLAVVIVLHLLLGWVLASGLARQAIEIVKRPIQASIIPELAPPPPPPPKVEKIRERPKVNTPPPPAYVPPPDVTPQVPPTAPVISATQSEPPKEVAVIAPPAPPAPPAPAPQPAPVKQEISLACPGYQSVLAQTLEDAFDRVGIVGSVRTRIVVRGNQVVDAVAVSGPKEYYKYVQTAIKRMKCSAGGADEVQVTLDVSFAK